MTVPTKPLHEITRDAIHILSREIGVVDSMRFLSQFDTGSGNHTEEREALPGDVSLEDILSEVRRESQREP